LFKGHAACYSPLSKHKFEESNAKALGPVYRFRNYNKLIVVVNSPELQQEVGSHLKTSNARFTMSFLDDQSFIASIMRPASGCRYSQLRGRERLRNRISPMASPRAKARAR
jgi:hypothetical protein